MAINSGLAVRRQVLRTTADEGQFLDYVDHAFLRDITARTTRIHILRTLCCDSRLRAAPGETRCGRKVPIFRKGYNVILQEIRHFAGAIVGAVKKEAQAAAGAVAGIQWENY